ncbi:helix-turn-helix domain-containing protein [Alicyclobacillus acidocaldarius]|uniref:helix-turn-helix domain-containing protein n=1 Tax=Alicyclobacillus acidocaldarius TaxID=405212 RepID=UPI00373AF42C
MSIDSPPRTSELYMTCCLMATLMSHSIDLWFLAVVKCCQVEMEGVGNVGVRVKVSRLQSYLFEQNWTPRDLANRMGVSYTTVYRVLSGKRRPGNDFIAKLLAATGKQFEEFFQSERGEASQGFDGCVSTRF